MSSLSEEEIIKNIKEILSHAETQLLDYEALSLQGLLELYNKEKEKNIQDMIKDIECSKFIKERYISKDKIKEKLKEYKRLEKTAKNQDNIEYTERFNKVYLYTRIIWLLQELLKGE